MSTQVLSVSQKFCRNVRSLVSFSVFDNFVVLTCSGLSLSFLDLSYISFLMPQTWFLAFVFRWVLIKYFLFERGILCLQNLYFLLSLHLLNCVQFVSMHVLNKSVCSVS